MSAFEEEGASSAWEADDARLMRFLYPVAPKRSFDFLTVKAAIGRKRHVRSSFF